MARTATHRIALAMIVICVLPGILFAVPIKEVAIDPAALNAETPIREWGIIGPFRFDPGDISSANSNRGAGGLNRDYLANQGHPEASLDAESFANIAKYAFSNRSSERQSELVPLDRLFPNVEYAVAYAGSVITSTSDADIGLATGSDDGQKVWLNGELLLSTPNTYLSAAEQYDRFAVAHLKKGKNFLLVKVDQKKTGWRFFLSIMPLSVLDKVAQDVAPTRDNRIVSNRLLKSGEKLVLAPPYAREAYPVTVTLTDPSGKQVHSVETTYAPSLPISLPPEVGEGFYEVSLKRQTQASSFSVHDYLYVGNPGVLYRQLTTLRDKRKAASSEYLSLNVLAKRYEVLNLPEYRNQEDRNWQNKLLFVLHEAAMATSSPANLDWTKTPGIHLREFISTIDSQPQDYALILPDGVHGPMPLLVSFPAYYAKNLPFISGPRLTYFHEIDGLRRAANKTGSAILLFFARGNAYGAPVGETDLFEVLKDIQTDFEIDQDRIYGYGECVGGQRALVMAEHFPSLFAAVATYGLGIPHGSAPPYPGTRTDIYSLAGNLTNTKLLLLNGTEDESSPLPMAKLFYEQMRSAGVPVEFQTLPGGEHIEDRAAASLIAYLVRQKRERVPNVVHLKAYQSTYGNSFWLRMRGYADSRQIMEVNARYDSGNFVVNSKNAKLIELDPGQLGVKPDASISIEYNGEPLSVHYKGAPILIDANLKAETHTAPQEAVDGPINEAFADSFIVVVGTRSSMSRETALAFAQRWKEDFFTDCRVKKDVDLTNDDLRDNNLILIGEPSPKSIISSVGTGSLVQRKDGKLTIAGQPYNDSGIQYAVSQPNPLAPNRYLVLVNSRPERWKASGANLALAATQSNIVWDERGVNLESSHR